MVHFNTQTFKFTLLILLLLVSKIINAQIKKTTIPLNFDCTPKVDLNIYSPNTASPVPDDEEFTVGATGVANEDDFIVVEFLEIPNVQSGEVTLKFEMEGENTGTYYVWEEDFSDLLGTFTMDVSLTLTKNINELPFIIWLQTPGTSDAYRDVKVEMDYDGIVDEARATIYEENTNPYIRISNIAEISHQWRPDNPYNGTDVFLSNISDALDFIHTNNLGNYQLKSSIGGNVITDFLAGGILSFTQVQIIEEEWGSTITTYDIGNQVLISNGRGALKIFDHIDEGSLQQEEGYIAPFVFIIHELAHIWLNKRDPFLKNFLSSLYDDDKQPFYPQFGLSGHDYTDDFEHDLILEKLENPACEQFMYGVRKYYRNAVYADSEQQMQILTLQQSQVPPTEDDDIFYKSENSISIIPE